MQEFLFIAKLERRALLRGLLLSFILTFPFTFIPTIISNGFSISYLLQRVPISIQYSAGFAALVVIVALFDNYQKLVYKKRLFDFPAFKELDFYGRVEGYDSIVDDLSTFLLGRIDNYYFKIEIVDPELKKFKIRIAPLMDIDYNSALWVSLKKELKLKEDIYLFKEIHLTEEQLLDADLLKTELINFEIELLKLNIPPLLLDENKL